MKPLTRRLLLVLSAAGAGATAAVSAGLCLNSGPGANPFVSVARAKHSTTSAHSLLTTHRALTGTTPVTTAMLPAKWPVVSAAR